MHDNRDLLFDELIKTAAKNKKYVFLCNDMDVFSLVNFKKKYPERVINVGVAEQNLVNVAAGLASQRFIPIVYTFRIDVMNKLSLMLIACNSKYYLLE